MTPGITQTEDWLRAQGFRVTGARQAVIKLLEESPAPLSLHEIHQKLPTGEGDFSTVFRFMDMLEAKGLIERIPWIDGSIRYHLHDEHHHRHYLICRQCQRVETIEGCALGQDEHQVSSKCGYTDITHVLIYSGICPICQKARNLTRSGKEALRSKRVKRAQLPGQKSRHT
jgi:Fur family ferric uptake transcriptional regulator